MSMVEEEPRTEVLTPIRVTPTELELWRDRAETGGETFSEFIRRALNETRPLIHVRRRVSR